MVPKNEPEPAPRARFSGRIQGTCVPELLHDLHRARRTGALRFHRSGVNAEIWFEAGRIVHAASDAADLGMGAILVRDGKITLDHLGPAGSSPEQDDTLPARLIDAGVLSPSEVDRALASRARAVIGFVSRWDEGAFEFNDRDELPPGPRVSLPAAELIVEGARRSRSFQVIRAGVGSPQTSYRLAREFESRLEGLTLNEAERLLLDSLREKPRTVEALCLDLYLSNFEVYQALWAFRILGAIEVVERPAAPGEFRCAGRLEREEFVAVLVRLCREGETGVLHVSNGSIDRTFHVREGRCVFATSTNPDDGLVSHLFRRGVISLKDREEVGRRLLTNKRVGTILLEMGVIDAQDVDRTVREQITEILNDTVRWRTGEYWFAPGELPTLEEITLVSSLEDLVVQAVRSVREWSRVLGGVGGPDARVELSPRYLDVLDRMTVGGSEWDLVALLARPRTVREICRESGLGDFTVCQTLWSLDLLGAVARVPDFVPEAISAVEHVPEVARVETEAPVEVAAQPAEPEPAAVPAELPEILEPQPVETVAIDPPVEPVEASPVLEEPSEATPEPSFPPVQSTDEGIVADQPLAAVAEAPAFELGEPGCDTEPYMADSRRSEQRDLPLDGATERQIEWLNACQQAVYRVVRAEVGAGAANFVRFCGSKLADGFGDVFSQVELDEDGSWQLPGLRAALRRHRPGDTQAGFQRLIDQEIEMVQVHLGADRADVLRRKIGELEKAATI